MYIDKPRREEDSGVTTSAGQGLLKKSLKLCTAKVPSPPETALTPHALFRTKPTNPKITVEF